MDVGGTGKMNQHRAEEAAEPRRQQWETPRLRRIEVSDTEGKSANLPSESLADYGPS